MSEVKIYSTCEECPLSCFIKAWVKGELKALIISGEPTVEDLAEAWGNLYAGYIDANADNEQMYVLTLQKEIILIHQEISEVEGVLYFLSPQLLEFSSQRKVELLSILSRYEYDIDIDLEDPSYTDKLQIVSNRLAPKRLGLQMKTKELESYLKDKESHSIDEKYFTVWLRRLATFQKCVIIRAKDITVEDFVLMIHEFYDHHNIKQEEENG